MNTYKIITGDCIKGMQTLPDGCIHTCITSPPYFGLRDYLGGDEEIGSEDTVEEYVNNMVEVFREVKRILRDDGTLWLNLGDSYMSQKGVAPPPQTIGGQRGMPVSVVPGNRKDQKGLKHKDLIGIPWRVAFALQADGWWLRQDIIWNKPNPMPESVSDRCTKAHEYIFLLSKKSHYYFDHEAIKEDAVSSNVRPRVFGATVQVGTNRKDAGNTPVDIGKRNKRSVWTVNTKGYKGAHFAVYPEKLIEPCVLAGTSGGGCCSKCGAPFVRVVEHGEVPCRTPREKNLNVIPGRNKLSEMNSKEMKVIPKETVGWKESCTCEDSNTTPCTVFDPFTGSGTTAVVTLKNGRNYIGTELNPDYVKIAEARIKESVPQNLEEIFE